ncbi:hypothetical protein [Cupriavidus sp. AU9028]|uniref:hypothetical protein n=1 Tax=Cupriavidus sp. AU9028 TaxID=2871157 RepID=UPI00351D0BD3
MPSPILPAWARRARHAVLALPLALALLACSPRYDWRTVQSNEGAYAALYPAKPSSAARQVTIAGRRLPMTMDAARVDDTLFAVGVVTLPADDARLRQEAIEAMQAGLAANVGAAAAEPVHTREVTVMSAGNPALPLPATEVRATGVSGEDRTPRRMTAWLVGRGTRVYQAVVLESGDTARDDRLREQIEQFLAGFHPF